MAEKKEIKYEACYTNNYSSKIFARARMNALQLEKQKGKSYKNYDTTCKLCGEEEEDIVHFTVKCKMLEGKRNDKVINKNIMDPEERMKDFLFRNKDYAEVRRVIRDIWVLRNRRLKDLERSILTEKRDEGKDRLTTGDQPRIQPQSDPPRKGIQKGGSGNLAQNSTPRRGTILQNSNRTW